MRCPKSAKTSWSQKGWYNKPTKLQFQSILTRKFWSSQNATNQLKSIVELNNLIDKMGHMRISSTITYCKSIIKTLRVIWFRCIPLSLRSKIRRRAPVTSLYDKHDDLNFHITNFPFLSSNIPSWPAYSVFISQLIRYARACSAYECFILRAVRLSYN